MLDPLEDIQLADQKNQSKSVDLVANNKVVIKNLNYESEYDELSPSKDDT